MATLVIIPLEPQICTPFAPALGVFVSRVLRASKVTRRFLIWEGFLSFAQTPTGNSICRLKGSWERDCVSLERVENAMEGATSLLELYKQYLTLSITSVNLTTMERRNKATWTLAELAKETAISPRTIRYYIARGLLDGPLIAGRDAAYSVEHLERLRTIQRLQSRGLMLAEIGRILAAGPEGTDLPVPESWHRYVLADDVVVLTRSDRAPWRARKLQKALAELAARIKKENDDESRG